jgi:hypothetical protein
VDSVNTPSPGTINPARVRYIKLGGGGSWEQECLEKGIIRIGFGTAGGDRFALCQSGGVCQVVEKRSSVHSAAKQ